MAKREATRDPRKAARRGRIKTVGLERAPHKDFYHYVLSRSWAEFFFLAGLTFLGANALFAAAYLLQPGAIAHARPGSFEDAFYFSVQTMATIGYGGMYPTTRFAHMTVTLEAMTGILATALITGITFTRFARPTARVLFADKIVLSGRDGVPHLMFRMANWRRNQIVEAQLRVVMLLNEQTREGDVMRRFVDVPLVRDRTAMFSLTWTAMHHVDERSPFWSVDGDWTAPVERLREKKAELYLTLTGWDETIGQTIHARHAYTLDDIVMNARFADVLSFLPDGTRVIDYRKFHDVTPVDAPAAVRE